MKRIVVGAAALFWVCAAQALAAPGDLDRSFGYKGALHSDVGGADQAEGVLVRPTGRIVVAGHTDVAGQLDFALTGHTRHGSLYRRVTVDTGGEETLGAAALQPDGKVVLAGQSQIKGVRRFDLAIARVTTDGRPDPEFGAGRGWVKLSVGDGWVQARLIQVAPDGKLVVVGLLAAEGNRSDLVIARLQPDGSPDLAFAPGGIATTPFHGGSGAARAFAADGRGGFLVAGSENLPGPSWLPTSFVQRFSLTGELDTSFGSGGTAVLTTESYGPTAVAVQSDGRIVLALGTGTVVHRASLVSLTAAGALERSFATLPAGFSAPTLVVDAADRVVVGSVTVALLRYQPDGERDRRFVTAIAPRDRPLDPAPALALTPGGRIVAAGSAPPGALGDFNLVRFHGGNDARPPRLRARLRVRGCARADFRLDMRARDSSGLSLVLVRLDGHRLTTFTRGRFSAVVPARRLRPGRHRLEVRARDKIENVAVRRLTFHRCA